VEYKGILKYKKPPRISSRRFEYTLPRAGSTALKGRRTSGALLLWLNGHGMPCPYKVGSKICDKKKDVGESRFGLGNNGHGMSCPYPNGSSISNKKKDIREPKFVLGNKRAQHAAPLPDYAKVDTIKKDTSFIFNPLVS
jgi:hypothetical protein